MGTPTTYTYSISTDFPNGRVEPGVLASEIMASSIVTALDSVGTVGDDCNITFKDPLSTADESTLNGLVAAHQGDAPPSEVQQVAGTVTVEQATGTSLQTQIEGKGTAGSPSGGVVSVQGVGSGTPQPISVDSLPLPSGAATETSLGTDGAAPPSIPGTGIRGWLRSIYDTVVARLPVSLVGGRLDANLGAWLGSTAPAVGQKTSANSIPAVLASDQPSIPTRSAEKATFLALATAVQIGNNKSMISIQNATGSTVVVRLQSLRVLNTQTTAVTGVVGTFEMRRCTGHSGGTAITAIERMDTADSLNASVTVRTNATIAGESTTLGWRALFTTDEWGVGTLDNDGFQYGMQVFNPFWQKPGDETKPFTLRAGEALNIKFATNSTAGQFDLAAVFTQE